MNPGALALPLIAVSPLLAASARLPLRIAACAAAAGIVALAWFFFNVADAVAIAIVPIWIVATLVTLRFASRVVAPETVTADGLEALRKRRVALRVTVAAAERDEARALQIYGAAKAMAGALSLEEMGPRVTSAVQRLFDSYEFILYAMEDGRPAPLQRRGTWKREPPIETFLREAAVVRPPAVAEIVPVLFIPIQLADKPLGGALFVKVTPDAAREEEMVRIAADLGPQLGMALAKALLFRQLENQSRRDGLTGTLRRQPFLDRLAEEFKRGAVFKTRFSLLMLDIDHFKSINDNHGHPAGDAVLTRIGKVLNESIYETDVAGRYGGEEFVVLLPRSEPEGALRRAEALRRRIESEKIQTAFGELQVTVSIGLANFPAAGMTADELIGAADKALYAAKEGGRNRVVGR